jgi:hypothetical protein
MVALLGFTLTLFDSSFRSKSRLEAENAALRHQLTVLRRRVRGRVQLTNSDRLFFMQLYRWFPSVLKAITIERPETLVRWHRVGLSPVVCTDNLRPYVLVTESPNVMGDDRTVMFLTGAVRLAVQIKEPARGRERCTSASTDRAAAEGEGACPTLERRSLVPHPVVSMVSVGFEGGHDHPARDPRAWHRAGFRRYWRWKSYHEEDDRRSRGACAHSSGG